jgi:hypothetical protein
VCSFLANFCSCSWLGGDLDDSNDADRVKAAAASVRCIMRFVCCCWDDLEGPGCSAQSLRRRWKRRQAQAEADEAAESQPAAAKDAKMAAEVVAEVAAEAAATAEEAAIFAVSAAAASVLLLNSVQV